MASFRDDGMQWNFRLFGKKEAAAEEIRQTNKGPKTYGMCAVMTLRATLDIRDFCERCGAARAKYRLAGTVSGKSLILLGQRSVESWEERKLVAFPGVTLCVSLSSSFNRVHEEAPRIIAAAVNNCKLVLLL